jgi:hypothetical protein
MWFIALVFCNRYKAVFGLKEEKQKPTCLGDKSGIMTLSKKLEIDKKFQGDEYKCSSVQVSLSSFKFIDVKDVFGLNYLSLYTIISTCETVWKNLEVE